MDVVVIDDGLVRVDHGPMVMTIRASSRGKPITSSALRGAEAALMHFAELAVCREHAKRNVLTYKRGGCHDFPAVLRRMIEACLSTKDPTLTPMAAVAGALADVAADACVAAGATKVLVDNGGDIAIRLAPGERARIGIRSSIALRQPDHVVEVSAASGMRGIATSGLGGRSFTKGIATAATAAASSGALADACATVVGNSTFIRSPRVVQSPAETHYPDTDIRGHLVTDFVGELLPGEIRRGLAQARQAVRNLPIKGTFVCIRGQTWATPAGFAKPLL